MSKRSKTQGLRLAKGGKISYITVRIQVIQKELELLKKSLESPEEVESIEGLWKGVKITEEDIQGAKQSLFKGAYKFGS